MLLKFGAGKKCCGSICGGAGVVNGEAEKGSGSMRPLPKGDGVTGSLFPVCEQQDDGGGGDTGTAGIEGGTEQQEACTDAGGAIAGTEQHDEGGCGGVGVDVCTGKPMSTGSVVTCNPRATKSWKKIGWVSSASGVDAPAPLLWPHLHFFPPPSP